MTGLEFMENINFVDDDLIFEAENWVRSKSRKISYTVGAGILAAGLCLAIGLTVNYAKGRNTPIEIELGCTIPGADEIYPTIMVDGTLYEWHLGVALIDELPVGSTYYGKIKHTDRTTPENDRELVSVFNASGRIFIDPVEDLIYLELTTDWLEKQLIIFEPQATSERYQAELELQLQNENADVDYGGEDARFEDARYWLNLKAV